MTSLLSDMTPVSFLSSSQRALPVFPGFLSPIPPKRQCFTHDTGHDIRHSRHQPICLVIDVSEAPLMMIRCIG